jgi:hypothetical protein
MNRFPARTGAGLLLSIGLALGAVAACSTTASQIPSIAIPTALPSFAIPSVSVSIGTGGVTGCVDPALFAILSQTMQSGADVQSILNTNKPALISGLSTFQPTDSAAIDWKAKLVNALNSGQMNDAADQIERLTSGQVNISSC